MVAAVSWRQGGSYPVSGRWARTRECGRRGRPSPSGGLGPACPRALLIGDGNLFLGERADGQQAVGVAVGRRDEAGQCPARVLATVSGLGEARQSTEPLITICRYIITYCIGLSKPECWVSNWTEGGTRCVIPGPEGPEWLFDSASRRVIAHALYGGNSRRGGPGVKMGVGNLVAGVCPAPGS